MKNLELNSMQKKLLLRIARETVENTVSGSAPDNYSIDDPVLNTECGAFVTIHDHGNLRGCIGNITARTPLWKTVMNMAVEASIRDPRFPSVSADELDDIDIEISALSPLWKIKDIEEIKIGRHGILIKKGFDQGLLLPQVATENNFNRKSFLEHTCLKAGLDRNCYKDKNCEIHIFSATVFREADKL
jgi:AmmeMemoRadiSam system protein A